MSAPEPYSQLRLRFTDPIQSDYELIRPVVLHSQPIAERSRETETARTTVNDKAKRFITEGMLGLVDKRGQPEKAGRDGYPDVVANYIFYLKQLYPPINYREIVRIIGRKFGYKTNHHTVKQFLKRHEVPVQLELDIVRFHEFEDAYQARWTVVRLFSEGWNKKSIAGLLKLSRKHVATIIHSFEKDGFTALEDSRTRPENHPHNQLTLPFMEQVFEVQKAYPDAGRFRVHGILEQQMGDETPSERTVGRAMAYNRVFRNAPNPLAEDESEGREPTPLPYQPLQRHQYWFIDIRYLVKLDGKWVYSICLIEGYSRKILAGMASRYQDEIAILQLLHAALSEYGTPEGIVSDNGSVFTAAAFKHVLECLKIASCPIEKRQPWQNLIESQFNIQRRLADAHFLQSSTFEEIQQQHAAFIQLFNTTRHWAHRNREDGKVTPVEVLGWEKGNAVTPAQLRQAFRHLQFPRTVNRYGCVSVQRFYIYAERGLARQRVAVWIYQGKLHIAYQQTMLSLYQCKLDRDKKQLTAVSNPRLYQTLFASPQLEFFELDDEEWLKVRERPPYIKRRSKEEQAKQLALIELAVLFWLILVTAG